MFATAALFRTLGLDTLAVAIGLGLSGLPRSLWLRVGLVFALFEGLMPSAGLVAGAHLSRVLGARAQFGAALLLVVVGIRAIRESLSGREDKTVPSVQGTQIMLTALSVSIDELAVGFSLGVLHLPIGPALVYISIQALFLTLIGLSVGHRVSAHLGERAELVSGVVLTLVGIGLAIDAITGSRLL